VERGGRKRKALVKTVNLRNLCFDNGRRIQVNPRCVKRNVHYI
jgi:hypothetical protein